MEDERRRIRCRLVQFIKRRQASLRKLELREAADHEDPLGRRRTAGLFLEHAHAWEDRRVADLVKKSGRKKVVIDVPSLLILN